jgi:hypothetical protein
MSGNNPHGNTDGVSHGVSYVLMLLRRMKHWEIVETQNNCLTSCVDSGKQFVDDLVFASAIARCETNGDLYRRGTL